MVQVQLDSIGALKVAFTPSLVDLSQSLDFTVVLSRLMKRMLWHLTLRRSLQKSFSTYSSILEAASLGSFKEIASILKEKATILTEKATMGKSRGWRSISGA
jgi:hypothetical protein